MELKLKICGMKYPENIREIIAYQPDFLGFIFYPKSPRFVDQLDIAQVLKHRGQRVSTTGVFVNSPVEEVLSIAAKNQLDVVQLHGQESAASCAVFKKAGLQVIKVFSVNDHFDWQITRPYETVADYFLFDTKTELHGGSGKTFNWSVLSKYNNQVPFFLSGGLDLKNIDQVSILKDLNIFGLDINSRFEIRPGWKDPGLIGQLVDELQRLDYIKKKI
ncbi:MAG: phosphoribosylanthranilate isomerase [Candidatus Cyclobacteriaceae bacterium M3_2C_046]